MTENRGTGIWHCDTEVEYEEQFIELLQNPDFTLLGHYESIQGIFDDLEYQGFTEEQIEQMSHNRYGACLEILDYASNYVAFMGTR